MRRLSNIFTLVLLVILSTSAYGQHFDYDITGANHSQLVIESRINGEFTVAGDEVAVFTPGGVCAGSWVYEESGENAVGFPAFKDDPDQQGINGFRAGEAFSYRFWDSETEHEVAAEPEFLEGPEVWEQDGFTVLNLSGNLEGPPILALYENGEALGELMHDFGGVLLESSRDWVVTIKNDGIDELVIESLTADPEVFSTDFPDEGASLSSGGTMDLTVTFTPADEQDYDGSITFVSNNNDGDVVVELVGSGTVEHIPDIIVDPLEFDFGQVVIGEPGSTDITISNAGNSDLTVSSVDVNDNAFTTDFSGETAIAEGESLVLHVVFDPDAEQQYSAVLTISSDDPDQGEVEVQLMGEGYIPPQPNIAVDPGEIEFGNVIVGETATTGLTITNNGDQPLAISAVTSDNEVFTTDYQEAEQNGPHFQFDNTDGNHSILVLEALLNGDPLEVDDEVGVFSTDGLCCGASLVEEAGAILGLAAWGDVAGEEGINGLRADEEMSFRYWDRSARREIAADAQVEFGSLNYTRDGYTEVYLSAGNQGQPLDIFDTMIQPGESLNINVTFEPNDYSEFNGTLTISSNDPDAGELEIALSGVGVQSPPIIEVDEDSHDFGVNVIGSSSDWGFTVSNSGVDVLRGTVELEDVEGSGAYSVDPVEFAIEADNTLDFTVTFSPEEVGDYVSRLHLMTNDPDNEDYVVDLSGSGREPQPDIYIEAAGGNAGNNQVAHAFGQVFIGDSNSWDLSIANNGEVDLTIDEITSDDGDFNAEQDNLPITISVGESVSVSVSFAPQEERAYSATLTVVSDDPDAGEFPVLFSGTGVLERLPVISAINQVDFMAVIAGESRTIDFEVSNAGLADLTISQVSVDGEFFSTDFEGDVVVSPNDMTVINLTFSPENVGDYEGSATIFSDDPDQGEFVVSLMGRCIPSGVHFEYTITSDNMSVIVEDASIDGERLVAGDEVAVFTTDGTCAGSELITDEWPIGVAVWSEDNNEEGTQGFRDGEAIAWKIWDQSAGEELNALGEYSEGNGVYHTNSFSVVSLTSRHELTPRIELNTDLLDFTQVLTGEARSLTVQISNVGDGDLIVDDASTDGAPFSVAFDNALTIEPGMSADLEVAFSPEEAGEFEGVLTIVSNAFENEEVMVTLVGVGIEPSPAHIVLSSDRHSFGELGVGERAVWDLEVSNTGGEVLTVEAPAIDGDGFEISPDNGFDLGVGESTTLHVAFVPDQVGEFSATLTLASNDPDNGEVSVSLVGSAIDSPFHWRFTMTDNNMSILIEDITIDGEQVPAGTEVSVFTTDGTPAGSERVEEFALGLAAWGDDLNTEDVVEGFVDGEEIAYKLWLPEIGAEIDAVPEYSEGDGSYHANTLTVLTLSATIPEGQGHFVYQVTGANHSLLVTSAVLNDEMLVAGDEVAVFTTNGICGGAFILEEDGDQAFGLAAWGDDLDTQPVEGFANQESFAFRYWDASASREYSGVVPTYQEGPEVYNTNGFTVISLDLYTLPQPEITLETAHDFGTISAEVQATWDFTITNDGNADLIVSDVSGLDYPFSVAFEGEVTVAEGEAITFTVTFAPESAGDFQGTMTVTSNDRNEGQVDVALTGSAFNPNHPPVWVDPPETVEGAEGSLIEFTMTATDADENDLTISLNDGTLPEGAAITDNGDGTGSFAWTPGFMDAGGYEAVFAVSDGEFVVDTTVHFEIANVNAPPQFVDVPDAIDATEGSLYETVISAVDIDEDQFEMTFEFVGTEPNAMPELTANGDGTANFSWTPSYEDAGDYTIAFHLLSENEFMPDVVIEVSATVTNVNRDPEIVQAIEDVEVNEDSGTTEIADLNNVFSDPDGDALSFDASGADELGVAIDENGILSVTPVQNFNGEGEVTVVASDGQNFALVAFRPQGLGQGAQAARIQPQRRLRGVDVMDSPIDPALRRDAEVGMNFMVTVLSVNDAPIWTDVPGDAFDINEADLIEFEVSASDVDGDDLTLTFDPGNFPEEVTLEDNGDGTGSFHWQTGYFSSGNYRGELVVADGRATARSVVFITVHNVNRAPVWDDVPEEVNGRENTEIAFDITGSDPDDNALTISMTSEDLPEGATLQDHHDGTATFSWTPNFVEAGDYSVTFHIRDNAITTDAEAVIHVADVNRPPVSENIPDMDIDEDPGLTELYNLPDNFNDPDGDEIAFSVQADDALNASIQDGALFVEPDANINGDFEITVSADDGEFRVDESFTLTINPVNDEPFWVGAVEEINVDEGDRIEFELHAEDVDLAHEGDHLEISLRIEDGVIQHGANFSHDGPDGSFIWDTDFDDFGTYRPVFRVEDNSGTFADITVTIIIGNVNRPPTITEPTEEDTYEVSVNEDELLRVDFAAEDLDGNSIDWTLPDNGGMPDGYQFTDHGDGTATLLWTPPFDANRQPYRPVAVATDELGDSDQLEVIITVENVNRDPIIVEPANADIFRVEIEEGQELAVRFETADADGGNHSWEVTDPDGLPNGYNFTDNGDGTADFTWNVPFDAQRDPYTPEFTVTDDGGATDMIVVEITVRDHNRPPVISEPSDQDVTQVDVDENAELAIAFAATDLDQDQLTWEMVDDGGLPGGWGFVDGGDGTAAFTWTPGFEDARQNPYVAVFRVADQEPLEDIIRVEITVNNVNRPPTPQGQIQDVVVDEDNGRYEIGDLRQYFVDPDDEALVFSIAGNPAEMGMAIENGNNLFFTPDANYNLAGGALITVTATDSSDETASQQFRVTIRPVNDSPNAFNLISPRDGTVLADYRGSLVWGRSVDIDNDQVRYSLVFTFIDAVIDTVIRRNDIQDTTYSLNGLDSLVFNYGLGDSLRISWWIESTDGQVVRESNQRWRLVVPPLSAPGDGELMPTIVSLSQNYPNPFNSETKISFELPKASDVKLTVFDMHARVLATLANGHYEAGKHESTWNAISAPAGVYLFTLQVDGKRYIVKGAMLK